MKRSVVETILGAIVLCIAGVFLFFSYNTANVKKVSGYTIYASFAGIGGLAAGDDVLISGVKVGTVSEVKLNQKSYLADVIMDIDPSIKVPDDSAALISSTSLLGGKYLGLEPGGSETYLQEGGRVLYTQAPQNLEQLLGQFIFSMNDDDENSGASGANAAAPTPSIAPISASSLTPTRAPDVAVETENDDDDDAYEELDEAEMNMIEESEDDL